MHRLLLLLFLLIPLIANCDRDSSTTLEDSQSEELEAPLEEEQEEAHSIKAWHQARAQTFGSLKDLKPLIDIAGTRDLILLGEATHGTKEFYTLRGELTLAIAEQKGLDFVVVEADWPSMRPVYEYVLGAGSEGDIDRVLINSFQRWPQWMWANEEFRDFLVALRHYNERNPDRPIRIYGLDVQAPEEAIALFQEILDENLADQGESIKEELKCITQFDSLNDYAKALHDQLHRHHGHGHGHDHGHSHGHNHGNQREVTYGDGESNCGPSMERLVAKTAEAFPTSSSLDINARMTAKSIAAAEEQQRARLSHRQGDFWNARAGAMYGIARDLLLDVESNQRGVVWAHNTHIGDARSNFMVDHGQINIGQLAREDDELGPEKVLSVGFSTYKGRVLAGLRWEAPIEEMTIPEAKEDSFDALLYRNVPEDHFFFFEPSDAALPFFAEKIPHRAIGVAYQPHREQFGNYIDTRIPIRYDALIFIAETEALTQLARE